MTFTKFWLMAYRDLGRNRRRSLFSLIAVALGLSLLILLHGYLAGVIGESLDNDVRLRTGHVQVRAPSYPEEKVSLQWKDLVPEAEMVAADLAAHPGVIAAAPTLWATAILNTRDESVGLRLQGIWPDSALYAPIRDALVGGDYLTSDDRGGILMGKRLADSLGLTVGDSVSLSVINADGQPDEAIFAIRGLFASGVPTFDESTLLMPLARAQALTRTERRASAVVLLLPHQDHAPAMAEQLRAAGYHALSWRDLNQVLLQTLEWVFSFYYVLDMIVMAIVAIIIANTLLMAVFERFREVGILGALGMKGRQIMAMFLIEALLLGIGGVIVGVVLGSAGVAYFATNGLNLGDEVASAAGAVALGSTVHFRFVPDVIAGLSLAILGIILVASLYPAWFAARQEPAVALRAQ
mgnify:CR=1 FL=1